MNQDSLDILLDSLAALRMLMREPLGDWVYDIRDNEMQGWEGPRVTAWAEAVKKTGSVLPLSFLPKCRILGRTCPDDADHKHPGAP